VGQLAAGGRCKIRPRACHKLGIQKLPGAFGNVAAARTVVPIDDWQIDAMVEAQLRATLKGRFTFLTVAFDPAAFADIPNDKRWRDTEQSRAIATLRNPGVDAYILVTPAHAMGTPGTGGLGFAEIGGFFSSGKAFENAEFMIDIADAHTGKTISASYSDLPNASPPFNFPLWKVDMSVIAGDAPTPEQRAAWQTDFRNLVTQSLASTLHTLQLKDSPLP
jgi:hypothetical protein